MPESRKTVRVFISSTFRDMNKESRRAREQMEKYRETIARAIHERYREDQARHIPSEDPAMAEWDNLLDGLKESNRRQADHIVEKLRQIGCTICPIEDRGSAPTALTDDEVEVMAEMEHRRWVAERLSAGWKRARKRDLVKKTSPHLVPWSELPDNVRESDRETVRRIPELLATVGLKVRRGAKGATKHGS